MLFFEDITNYIHKTKKYAFDMQLHTYIYQSHSPTCSISTHLSIYMYIYKGRVITSLPKYIHLYINIYINI